jgi:hypothetical protein
MKSDPAIDAIRSYLKDPKKKLSREHLSICMRLERVYDLYYDYANILSYMNARTTIETHAHQTGISKAQARLDLFYAQDLFSCIVSDTAARAIAIEMSIEAYKLAKKQADPKAMARAADAYRLAHGFDKRIDVPNEDQKHVPSVYIGSEDREGVIGSLIELSILQGGKIDLSELKKQILTRLPQKIEK